jgi:hypothetical protein
VDRPREEASEAPGRERIEPSTDHLRPESPALPDTAITGRRISTDSACQAQGNGIVAEEFALSLQNDSVDAFVKHLSLLSEELQQWAVAIHPLVFDKLCTVHISGKLNAESAKTLENIMGAYYGGMPKSVDELAAQLPLGWRIKDCGASGNNCLLLATLGARDALTGQNPPAEGYQAAAKGLRQQALDAMRSKRDELIADFKERWTQNDGITLTAKEANDAVKDALPYDFTEPSEEGEYIMARIAEWKSLLASKIREHLETEDSETVRDECRRQCDAFTTAMEEISTLNGLHKRSTGTQHLSAYGAAGYVTQIIGRDFIIVVESNLGYIIFHPKDDSSPSGRYQI